MTWKRGCPSDLEEGLLSLPRACWTTSLDPSHPQPFPFPCLLETGPTCSVGLSRC